MSFTVSKKTIDVKIPYIYDKENDILIVVKNGQEENFNKDKFKTTIGKFRQPSYGDYANYMDNSIKEQSDGVYLNLIKTKEQKVRSLLVELIDGDGNKVTLDGDFYNNIDPDFLIALLEAFEEQIRERRLKFLIDNDLLNLGEGDKEDIKEALKNNFASEAENKKQQKKEEKQEENGQED